MIPDRPGPPVDPADIVLGSLDGNTIIWLVDHDLSLSDVMAGKVPGIDPDAILAQVAEDEADPDADPYR